MKTANQIPDIPRQIAVAYADTYLDMRDTVKLASDIENYALSVVADRYKRIKELEDVLWLIAGGGNIKDDKYTSYNRLHLMNLAQNVLNNK